MRPVPSSWCGTHDAENQERFGDLGAEPPLEDFSENSAAAGVPPVAGPAENRGTPVISIDHTAFRPVVFAA
jgi:hypothetical protein